MIPETQEFRRRMATREANWLRRNRDLPSGEAARMVEEAIYGVLHAATVWRGNPDDATAQSLGAAIDTYDQLWED